MLSPSWAAARDSGPVQGGGRGPVQGGGPGAYDSPHEWARYDVTARAGEFAGVPLHMAIGADDPFAPSVRALRDRLPDRSVVLMGTGCHDGAYWTSVAPDQVRTIASALERR